MENKSNPLLFQNGTFEERFQEAQVQLESVQKRLKKFQQMQRSIQMKLDQNHKLSIKIRDVNEYFKEKQMLEEKITQLQGVLSKKNVGEISPRGIINLKHFDQSSSPNQKDDKIALEFSFDERRKAEFLILSDSFDTLNKKFTSLSQSSTDTQISLLEDELKPDQRYVFKYSDSEEEQKSKQSQNKVNSAQIPSPPLERAIKNSHKAGRIIETSYVCDKQHTMQLKFELPKKYELGAICDGCEKEINIAEGFLHCEKCEEDYCIWCAQQRANGTFKPLAKGQKANIFSKIGNIFKTKAKPQRGQANTSSKSLPRQQPSHQIEHPKSPLVIQNVQKPILNLCKSDELLFKNEIKYEPGESLEELTHEQVNMIERIAAGINQISQQQVQAIGESVEKPEIIYEHNQDTLINTQKAGEELKKAAVHQAAKKKNKLTLGLGVTGAVVGTVATGGIGGALIVGVAAGAVGAAVGKGNQNLTKRRLDKIQFHGAEKKEAVGQLNEEESKNEPRK